LGLGLLLSDGWVILITLTLAYWLRQNVLAIWYDPIQPWWVYVWLGLGSWLVWWMIGSLKHLYNWSFVFTRRRSLYLWRVWETAFLLGLMITSGSYLVKYDFSRIVVGVWWLMLMVGLPLVRLVLRELMGYFFEYRLLVVGRNRLSHRFVGNLKHQAAHVKLELTDKLPSRVTGYDEVVILDPSLGRDRVFNWLIKRANQSRQVSLGLNFFPRIFTDPSLRLDYDDLPRLSFSPPAWWYQRLKRLMDIVLSTTLIILTGPLMLLMGGFIVLKTGRWPVIKLTRVGEHGKSFGMYKFVTMKGKPKAAKAPTRSGDPRLYPWGIWLRRTSLDELPQLFNVLLGQMSLVGPRPEMLIEVSRYKPWQKIRLQVKPGLTGLWQILGRKDLPLSRNLQYDLYYVANQSLWLDLWILIKTPWIVLTGRGAY